MLKIDKSHACNPESILSAGDINPCFAVNIAIFRIVVSQSIINKVQAINTEVFKRHRTNSRRSAAFHVKCSASMFFIAGMHTNIDQNTAPTRPNIMQIRPLDSRRIETNT